MTLGEIAELALAHSLSQSGKDHIAFQAAVKKVSAEGKPTKGKK